MEKEIPAILLSRSGFIQGETSDYDKTSSKKAFTSPSKPPKRKEKERITLEDLSHVEMLLGGDVEKLVLITGKIIYEYSK